MNVGTKSPHCPFENLRDPLRHLSRPFDKLRASIRDLSRSFGKLSDLSFQPVGGLRALQAPAFKNFKLLYRWVRLSNPRFTLREPQGPGCIYQRPPFETCPDPFDKLRASIRDLSRSFGKLRDRAAYTKDQQPKTKDPLPPKDQRPKTKDTKTLFHPKTNS
jgi:hypothetical protein